MADLAVISYRQTRAIQERQAYSNPPPDSEPEYMSVHESLQRSGHQRSKREPEQPETSSHIMRRPHFTNRRLSNSAVAWATLSLASCPFTHSSSSGMPCSIETFGS